MSKEKSKRVNRKNKQLPSRTAKRVEEKRKSKNAPALKEFLPPPLPNPIYLHKREHIDLSSFIYYGGAQECLKMVANISNYYGRVQGFEFVDVDPETEDNLVVTLLFRKKFEE